MSTLKTLELLRGLIIAKKWVNWVNYDCIKLWFDFRFWRSAKDLEPNRVTKCPYNWFSMIPVIQVAGPAFDNEWCVVEWMLLPDFNFDVLRSDPITTYHYVPFFNVKIIVINSNTVLRANSSYIALTQHDRDIISSKFEIVF